MTREEQIQRESEVYAWTANQFDIQLAFIKGAEWADAHPQFSREEFIEKACKWLGKHINKTASIDADGDWGDDYLEVNNYDDEDMFLSAFRKAMEE